MKIDANQIGNFRYFTVESETKLTEAECLKIQEKDYHYPENPYGFYGWKEEIINSTYIYTWWCSASSD